MNGQLTRSATTSTNSIEEIGEITSQNLTSSIYGVRNLPVREGIYSKLSKWTKSSAGEICDFVEAIEAGRDVSFTGEDARAATAIAVAATLSLDEGRPVLVSEVL